jgi:AcrR family transcriptional regulator
VRPYGVGVKRREEILEAALELFSVHGYRGAPIAEVAARVGLTLAGVLHYFSSKEELLAAVLKRRDDLDAPWFEEKWAETGSLRGATLQLMSRNMHEPHVLRLFVTLSAESTDPTHPSHEYFQARYQRSRRIFTRTLEEAKARGEVVASVSPPILIAVLDGLQVQWLLEPSFDLLGEIDRYFDSIGPVEEMSR